MWCPSDCQIDAGVANNTETLASVARSASTGRILSILD